MLGGGDRSSLPFVGKGPPLHGKSVDDWQPAAPFVLIFPIPHATPHSIHHSIHPHPPPSFCVDPLTPPVESRHAPSRHWPGFHRLLVDPVSFGGWKYRGHHVCHVFVSSILYALAFARLPLYSPPLQLCRLLPSHVRSFAHETRRAPVVPIGRTYCINISRDRTCACSCSSLRCLSLIFH